MEIKIVVDAIPVAQPRQRHAIIAGHVTNYTPDDHPVNSFKASIVYSARKMYQGPVIDEPIEVTIIAVFPRTKNKIFKKFPMNREWKTTKPDVDNIQKSVYDALNGVLWRDDSLICSASTQKYIADGEENPKVIITIRTLNEYA